MKFPVHLRGLDHAELPRRPLHLAIGMFDGVHLGHQSVIEAAVQSARAERGLGAVLTFWPHPSVLLRPANPTLLIQTPVAKAKIMFGLGVDVVFTQPFTSQLAELKAADFLAWLQRSLPGLAAVYVGDNFRFGHGRAGDLALLNSAAHRQGIRVFSSPPVSLDGEPISSTRIRRMLVGGEMASANACLGYHYFSEGKIVPGKRLGHTLGFPTLNLAWIPDLRPRYGVYAVRVTGGRERRGRPAVANYGVRPTVGDASEPRLEAHVLGECPWGEGDAVRVEWLSFLRPEKKFEGLEQLRVQIASDRLAAERFFLAPAGSGGVIHPLTRVDL